MYRQNLTLYFLGIGGIGMSGIAELLWNLNYRVVGSDIADSDTLSHLRSLGMHVFLGHDASRLPAIAPDVVVVSSAIAQDNPEILEAKRLGIPVIPRAVMLAELMRLKYGIAVSGAAWQDDDDFDGRRDAGRREFRPHCHQWRHRPQIRFQHAHGR